MLRNKGLVALCRLRRLASIRRENFTVELKKRDLIGACGNQVRELFQDFRRGFRMHLGVLLVVLFEKHVFKDIKEVVDSLGI